MERLRESSSGTSMMFNLIIYQMNGLIDINQIKEDSLLSG